MLIKEAFAHIAKPVLEPLGMIDSLGVLSEKFGRRAGNMKVCSKLEAVFVCDASCNSNKNQCFHD